MSVETGTQTAQPRDRFGRGLLAVMGAAAFFSGEAIAWRDSGSGSVTIAVVAMLLGAAMITAAAFYYNLKGRLKYRDSEMAFGRDVGGTDDTPVPRLLERLASWSPRTGPWRPERRGRR